MERVKLTSRPIFRDVVKELTRPLKLVDGLDCNDIDHLIFGEEGCGDEDNRTLEKRLP